MGIFMNDDEKIKFGYLAAMTQRLSWSGGSKLRLWDYEFQVFSQWGEDGILITFATLWELQSQTFWKLALRILRSVTQDFSHTLRILVFMQLTWILI